MIPRSEYPRPHFDRSHSWLTLNGDWDFVPDPDNRGLEAGWHLPDAAPWSQTITVPFAWETPASRVARHWLPVAWYRRYIRRPAEWSEIRTILHIGAAHYICMAWLNGQFLGEHVGGYFPFAHDLTDALKDGQGELILRVEAPIDKRLIPHGKQRSIPPDDYNDCAFTPNSGLWQSVWLESRPATYIDHVRLRATERLDGIEARITLAGPHLDGATLTLSLEEHDEKVVPIRGAREITVVLPVSHPQLWGPQTPYLYTLTALLKSIDGEDKVKCYTGLRKIEVRGNRLLLNGERLYIRGVLDQGFWPKTGYTAPSDAALRRDVELALAAGYNLVRKHLKLEDPRWLYWADQLGLLVWAEPPCVGRYTPEAIATFESQLAPMVARDGNHPSIILWGIYNEEWGLDWKCGEDPERQSAVERAYNLLRRLDRDRPIIDNSGWWHVKTDVVDWHYYDSNMARWRGVTSALASDHAAWFGHRLSDTRWYETQLSVPGRDHRDLPLLNGEYGGGAADEQGWLFRWQTQDLRRYDIFNGYIYTELYDVEYEKVGIYTAEREPKDLGCDPTTINAQTVIIFDVTPIKPGLDLLVENGTLSVNVLISHHGTQLIRGELVWSWDLNTAPIGSMPVEIKPFVITSPIRICASLSNGQTNGRLHVWIIRDDGQCLAYNFLDVATVYTRSGAIAQVHPDESDDAALRPIEKRGTMEHGYSSGSTPTSS